MQTTNQANELVRKMAKVMKGVSRIEKTGYNTFNRYHYATESDVVESVRNLLADLNIMMIPNMVEHTIREHTTRSDKKEYIATVVIEFTFIDGDSGQSLVIRSVGEGQDSGDKCVYKAFTGAQKYAIMKTFLIPTGDDPERDNGQQNTNNRNQQQNNNRQQQNNRSQNNNRQQNNTGNQQRQQGTQQQTAQQNVENSTEGAKKARFQKLFGDLNNFQQWEKNAQGFQFNENQKLQWLDDRLKEKSTEAKKVIEFVISQGGTQESAVQYIKKCLTNFTTFTEMLNTLKKQAASK